MALPLKGHECGGRCFIFSWGLTPSPLFLRKVSDLDQEEMRKFYKFSHLKIFPHIRERRQQLFQPPAIFAKIAEKLKSFRLSTPAFKKSVERSKVRRL